MSNGKSIRDGIERANKLRETINAGGNIFKEIEEGAAREAAAREDQQRKLREEEAARIAKEQAALNNLLSKTAASVTSENKAKAEAMILEETERAVKGIQDKYNKEHNVQVETDIDRSYKKLLGKLLGK